MPMQRKSDHSLLFSPGSCLCPPDQRRPCHRSRTWETVLCRFGQPPQVRWYTSSYQKAHLFWEKSVTTRHLLPFSSQLLRWIVSPFSSLVIHPAPEFKPNMLPRSTFFISAYHRLSVLKWTPFDDDVIATFNSTYTGLGWWIPSHWHGSSAQEAGSCWEGE